MTVTDRIYNVIHVNKKCPNHAGLIVKCAFVLGRIPKGAFAILRNMPASTGFGHWLQNSDTFYLFKNEYNPTIILQVLHQHCVVLL